MNSAFKLLNDIATTSSNDENRLENNSSKNVASLFGWNLEDLVNKSINQATSSDDFKSEVFNNIKSNASGSSAKSGMDVLGDLSQYDDTYFEKWLDNKIAQENTNSAREYETNMSNTAIQRAFQDAQNAGINPTYYLTGGGSASSTPIVATSNSSIGEASAYRVAKLQSVTTLKSTEMTSQATILSAIFNMVGKLIGGAL